MNKHNQNGSVHVVVISLLILALVGALGWIFWQNFLQPKPKAVSKAESSQSVSPSPTPSVQIKPETLSLSTWRVQFTITDELKKDGIEVEKQTDPTTNADGSQSTLIDYYVSTSRQRAFGQLTEENADKLCDAGSGVTVWQTTKSSTSTEGVSSQLTTKPIGGFYYTWDIPSAGGCDGPDTKAIVDVLKSLEAIN